MTSPQSHSGPERIKLRPDETLVVYRIVRGPERDGALLEAMKSNAEKGNPPRAAELEHPEVHEAISTWITAAAASAVARRFPQHGDYVARLELRGAVGEFEYAEFGQPGHYEVWASPLDLMATVADILPLEGDPG